MSPNKRTYEEECQYIEQVGPVEYRVKVGMVPGMHVEGTFFLNDKLKTFLLDELQLNVQRGESGGFIPAVKQIANVAALPGIMKFPAIRGLTGACMQRSLAMPDVHSGYGFAIGNVAAFDMDNPEAVVSPGGVGFDINCGVRLIRTNLMESQVADRKQQLAQALFDEIPVGVGGRGRIPTTAADLEKVLQLGMDWSLTKGYAWPEDVAHCEENGRMMGADPSKVSKRAKQRGLPQMGTLGAGNHYAEIQVVDEIFDEAAARTMGIHRLGQVVIMLHSGSRGLGHQVATDSLQKMEAAMARDKIAVNDRQLACALINSQEGKDYLAAMACAANYAWVNRAAMTYQVRLAFQKVFGQDPRDMDMHVIYDVSHNIAKVERHEVEAGVVKTLLVHRKGSTRAFPPHHPQVPADYQLIGQPVLIGGTMGTCSYVLTGTQAGMEATFGSTCHGAGRAKSRTAARKELKVEDVLAALKTKGIAICVASPNLVMEEAPESYKDVSEVVDTCHQAGISRKAVKLRPIAVIKG